MSMFTVTGEVQNIYFQPGAVDPETNKNRAGSWKVQIMGDMPVNGGGSIKRRIVDMGMVGGTAIEVCKFAPLGDPMEIKVKGCNLSLRKREAAFICVELENEGASRCTKND